MSPDVKGRPRLPTGKAAPTRTVNIASASLLGARAIPAESLASLPTQIADRITIDPVSGCWIAAPPLDRGGYARLGGRGFHREVWLRLVGEIAPGLVLDHREDYGCTSKACCWPGHLLETTVKVNTLRSLTAPSAINARKVKCDSGHPFDAANTYWRPNGHRGCRACIRRRVAEYKARLRGSQLQAVQAHLQQAA